jgi:hypothetical protein
MEECTENLNNSINETNFHNEHFRELFLNSRTKFHTAFINEQLFQNDKIDMFLIVQDGNMGGTFGRYFWFEHGQLYKHTCQIKINKGTLKNLENDIICEMGDRQFMSEMVDKYRYKFHRL